MGTSVLKLIYSLFLAIFLALFIGLGIEVFYPTEKAPEYPAELNYKTTEVYTADQSALQKSFDSDMESYQSRQGEHNRNVSIVAICASILLVALSLTVLSKSNIFSDGFLVGGLFTLIYGIGRGMASGSDKYRFVVVAVGLIVVMALGYLKFSEKFEKKS